MAMTEGVMAGFAGRFERLRLIKRRHREDGDVSAAELEIEDREHEELHRDFSLRHLEYQYIRAADWGGVDSYRAQELMKQLATARGQLYVLGPAGDAGEDLRQLA